MTDKTDALLALIRAGKKLRNSVVETRGVAAMDAHDEAIRAAEQALAEQPAGAVGKGPLPDGAVAWLDMGKGEASLHFNKSTDSNRASKKRAMELFEMVTPGYHALFLGPQAARKSDAEQPAGAVGDALAEIRGLIAEIDPAKRPATGDKKLIADQLRHTLAKLTTPPAAQEDQS